MFCLSHCKMSQNKVFFSIDRNQKISTLMFVSKAKYMVLCGYFFNVEAFNKIFFIEDPNYWKILKRN